MIRAPHLLTLAGFLVAACGDDGATKGSTATDSGPTGGTAADLGATGGTGGTGGAPVPDAAPVTPDAAPVTPDAAPDAAADAQAPDMNVVVPDAAVDAAAPDAASADAALPDAYAPLALDAGAACQPDSPAGTCGPFSQCIDGACHADLSPNVYIMTVANVVEPATAAEALNGALAIALQGHQINLLVEAAGYSDNGYRVNIGNGRGLDPMRPENGTVFNHELPIQNVYGGWVNDHGVVRFEQDGLGVFSIYAPGQTVGPNNAICWTQINTMVHVSVEPRQHDDGTTYVHARATGYMTHDDADAVVFYPFPGTSVALSMALVNEPLVDADLDGVADEYRFDIEIDAEAVPLVDNNPARSPDNAPENPPECNQ